MDKVAAAWSRGNYSNQGDASPATHRAMKTVRPMRLISDSSDGHMLHYLWPLSDTLGAGVDLHIRTLTAAARCIVALGWGIDAAIGDARVIDESDAQALRGERWRPLRVGSAGLRIPVPGTLDALSRRHVAFLHRVTDEGFAPVPTLSTFGTAEYCRSSDLPARPFAAFILRPVVGTRQFASFRPERAACVAAMLRHAACQAAKDDLDPGGWRTNEWSLRFVAGHGPKDSPKRRSKDDDFPRLSYLPLPSIGHTHAGGMIRRALIAEPFGGDGRSANWVARRLNGAILIDEDKGPVARLECVEPGDADFVTVFRHYAPRSAHEATKTWTSITPVILPGYDDAKPAKRKKLLLDCLRHAGIEPAAVAALECRAAAWTAVVAAELSAFKRPDYLKHLPAVHIRIEFRSPTTGPLALGAGRHCGLGAFAVES
jgi:CRISPR-associated protein Csb2